jgi:predicted enzyme related to lactoylglutathione lyase
MAKNLIQHIEWNTREPLRLRRFFSQIFDWKFSTPMPGYTLIEGIGGIFEVPDEQMPVTVIPYVNVDDLAATEGKIRAAGGKVYKSKQEVPGMGWFTIFADPDGNTLALWQAQPKRAAARRAPAKKKTAKKRPAAKPAKKKRR